MRKGRSASPIPVCATASSLANYYTNCQIRHKVVDLHLQFRIDPADFVTPIRAIFHKHEAEEYHEVV